jgi:hypothetical protein
MVFATPVPCEADAAREGAECDVSPKRSTASSGRRAADRPQRVATGVVGSPESSVFHLRYFGSITAREGRALSS